MTKAYVLDKDGTLVHHGEAIAGARELLARLATEDTPHVVLSNTGERDAAAVAADLARVVGVDVGAHRIQTARECMADALRAHAAEFDQVLVIGVAPPGYASLDVDAPVPRDARRTCVAVFSDGHLRDFCDAATAAAAWIDRGASFWITSVDTSIAVARADGTVGRRPGPGVFVDAVRAAARAGADVCVRVFGKEADAAMGRAAVDKLRAQGFAGPPRDVVMVGDRFDTDMRAGRRNGWSTCLVESGCHTLEAHARQFPHDAATAVASSVRDLAYERGLTMREAVGDVVREVLRHAPRSQVWAEHVAHRLCAMARRVDAAFDPPPRRIRSAPDLQAL